MKQRKNFSASGLKKLKEEMFRKSLNRKSNIKGCSCRNGDKK